MKYIITICGWLAMALTMHSQKTVFIRVSNEAGTKIHKGFLNSVSDSSLTIKKDDKITEVPVSKISVIKVKRSFGHTVALTSGIAAVAFSISGVASGDTLDIETAGGFLFGALAGAALGSIIGALKKTVLQINMDQKGWMKAKPDLSYYLEPGK